MKIAFIASRNISEIGGIENYMANLCPKLVEKGHKVILYTEASKYCIEDYKGVKIIGFKSVNNRFFNKILLGFKATLNVIFKQKNINIIHYNEIAAGFSSIIPILLGKHVVFQMHGIESQSKKWSPFLKMVIKILEKFVIGINKNIITVSQYQSNYIYNNFNKKAVTVYSATSIPSVNNNSSILNKYNLETDKYLLFLGRIVEEKRLDILIKAFNNLKHNSLKLVIAGNNRFSDKYINSLKQLAENNKNIIFTNSVFANDKDALLRNCLLFCSPSELEGLPITVLEAMSYKKICIASNIPAHKEILAENGIYFETNNIADLQLNIEKTIKDIDNLYKIGELNYLRIEQNFTWSIVSDNYEQYCKEILLK